MTCSACSAAVEAALEAVPGVAHAAVSLLQQEALAEYDPKRASEVPPRAAPRRGPATAGRRRGLATAGRLFRCTEPPWHAPHGRVGQARLPKCLASALARHGLAHAAQHYALTARGGGARRTRWWRQRRAPASTPSCWAAAARRGCCWRSAAWSARSAARRWRPACAAARACRAPAPASSATRPRRALRPPAAAAPHLQRGAAAWAASLAEGAGLAQAWPARSRPPRRCDACRARHARARRAWRIRAQGR
jgi:hypothetical protein